MSSEIDYPAEYDNSARVANSAELVNKYITDAANYREFAAERAQLNLTYGDGERNLIDIFWPDSEAGKEHKSPIVMFIHGGYWQRMDRSCFSHLSAGLNAQGIAVAMPSYTLCPHIEIEGIINEMRRASLVLYQTFQRPITVIGHSAGGHLAACVMATNWPRIHQKLPHDLIASGMGISGLYDLLPLCKTPVNDALGMDEDSALSASPIHWVPEALQKFEAWVGGEESDEYHRQSRELAARWSLLATPTRYVSVPGANHFTVVDELVKPGSPMVQRIVELIKHPVSGVDLPELDEEEVDYLMHQFVEASMAEENETADSNPAEPDEPNTDEAEPEEAEVSEKSDKLPLPTEALADPDKADSTEKQPGQPADGDEADTATQKQAE